MGLLPAGDVVGNIEEPGWKRGFFWISPFIDIDSEYRWRGESLPTLLA
jgi:DUF1365 family protein